MNDWASPNRAQQGASSPIMQPGASVIVPTFNCERYIRQTLDSVLAQTAPPLEVIVVDDGSSDATADIAQSYGQPVRVIRQRNQGVCHARNRGFRESRGEFVCFLDHDDYWYPWKLQRQTEAFQAHPQAGVVYTEFAPWHQVGGKFPDPRSLRFESPDEVVIVPEYSGWIYHHFLLTCWALTSTAMLRRGVLEQSGGFDASLPFAEDWDLWLRISRLHRFVKLEAVSTLYRQHPEQGNRKLRDTDYRTQVLESASKRWGLASADGRAIDRRKFKARLAHYHMQFGLHHLSHGNRRVALRSFARAWRHHPVKLKYSLLAIATCLGWTPEPFEGADAKDSTGVNPA